MKKPRLRFTDGDAVREHRRRLGQKQCKFWAKGGITQSGESRYEAGQRILLPIVVLLNLAYAPNTAAEAFFRQLRVKESPVQDRLRLAAHLNLMQCKKRSVNPL